MQVAIYSAAALPADPWRRPVLTIDVHNHYVPPEVADDARRGDGFDGMRTEVVDGQEWVVHRQGYRYPLLPAFHDHETRLAAMDERGVDVGVLSIAPTLFMYWTEASGAADFARRTNDALAAFAAEADGRIRPVANLAMQDPDAAVAELRRAVADLGMCGAQIGPVVGDLSLDDSSFRPLLAAAAELDVPLIVHPSNVGVRRGLGDFYLTNLVGNPLESTICAARLIFGGVLDELPGLRIVLMHGGGYLPYQFGRLDHGHHVRPEARDCAHDPSSYLTRFWYDTITHATEPLRYLIGLVGASRVVYGSDFPFDMAGGPYAEQLAGIELDPADDAAIRGGNAADLFGLKIEEA
ncbi:MAG: amidohydrolase family protein [Streptosporangiales bacterium]|nr:amidohydrolase family protein [Streptosporangiales bacterium]